MIFAALDVLTLNICINCSFHIYSWITVAPF